VQVIEVEYDCCGAKYKFPTMLAQDALLMANPALADTVVSSADALHDAEHPECPNPDGD
jgi:hypothetical protein